MKSDLKALSMQISALAGLWSPNKPVLSDFSPYEPTDFRSKEQTCPKYGYYSAYQLHNLCNTEHTESQTARFSTEIFPSFRYKTFLFLQSGSLVV